MQYATQSSQSYARVLLNLPMGFKSAEAPRCCTEGRILFALLRAVLRNNATQGWKIRARHQPRAFSHAGRWRGIDGESGLGRWSLIDQDSYAHREISPSLAPILAVLLHRECHFPGHFPANFVSRISFLLSKYWN